MASDGPSESDQGKPKTTPPNARVACNAGVITGIGEILFLPAVVWVGASVAAGVLGNAAYDAVKAALGRVRRRETATPPPISTLYGSPGSRSTSPALSLA